MVARRRAAPRRHPWRWALGGLALLLAAWVAWIGVRGMLARDELARAVPLAQGIAAALAQGDTTLTGLDELAERTASAAALTSDPLWRAGEIVPGLGANLTAVREAAGTVDDLVTKALRPLAGAATGFGGDALAPRDGAVDLQPLLEARPALAQADTALAAAADRAAAIDTEATLPLVGEAVATLDRTLANARSLVETASTAAQLLPAMLGADGPREYLLLFQNNAEVRAGGGIPGALALVRTDGGRIELAGQAAAADLPRFLDPVLPIDDETLGLYGGIVGGYIQNVTLTPDFPTSAELAREMWRRSHGGEVDGVIAVDPVALGYLLEATGPITLATGDELTPGNAVDLLLSGAYAQFPEPAAQDAFFAHAAQRVFEGLLSGGVDASALLPAIDRAADERRLLVWNARAEEQALLAGTSFEGRLPADNVDRTVIGVYLNDATGAKMDYYLGLATEQAMAVCRDDGRRSYRTEARLSNAAPPDAATALPEYVTGGGGFGVPPGNIRTRVIVYGPVGAIVTGASVNGEEAAYQPTSHAGRPIAQFMVELAPGEGAEIAVDFLGAEGDAGPVVVETTPTVYTTETKYGSLSCYESLYSDQSSASAE